jgi:plasmid stability protein
MSNLTITVDDDILRRARVRAVEGGTSVNAVLRDYLHAYAGGDAQRRTAMDQVLALSRARATGRGANRWTRDELHER